MGKMDMHRARDRPAEKGRKPVALAHRNFQEAEGPAAIQWEPLESQSVPGRRSRWLIPLGVVGLLLVGLVVYLATARGPTVHSGTVESIQEGTLLVSREPDATWQPVEEGQIIPQGTSIRSTTDTWATIAFTDQSLMRIEASGTWKVMELLGKGNRLHIIIEQKVGRASFVSPPPRALGPSRFQIKVANVTAELVGVGTFTTNDEQILVKVLEGHCILPSGDGPMKIVAGSLATIDPVSGDITVIENE